MKQLPKVEVDRYMQTAQAAMFQYQIIEEGLKTYIRMAHEIVLLGIPKELAFHYSDKEYDSMPLERLLNAFTKFTHNKTLLKQLNGLRESRNYFAHRSFALAFFSSVNDKVDFQEEFKKVVVAREAATAAFDALKDELTFIQNLKHRMVLKSGEA